MCIAPQASVFDGKMQLVILGNVTLLDYIKNLSRIKRGEIIDHEEIQYAKAKTCRIEAIGQQCALDMDGEFVGYTPLKMEILPSEVNMLVGI